MNNDMNFYKLDRIRKYFAYDNQYEDYVFFVNQNSRVLISAPHAVSQVRLGENKVAEIGSLRSVLWLNILTQSSYIIKTKNNFDDPNWDVCSNYKNKLWEIVEKNKVKYVLDFHGLASHRECDINFGTNLGFNIEQNVKVFDWLVSKLRNAGFVVSIDQPFKAGDNTVSWSTKKKFNDIWTCQIEVNTKITNRPENFKKFKNMIEIFKEFIEKSNSIEE